MHTRHDHARGHRATTALDRAFRLGIFLNAAFVAAEAGFGLWAGSLALLADAGHNLSDVLALVFAWGAGRLALLPPSTRRTYGLRRSTILAALVNAVILMIAVGAIAVEAIRRLAHPAPVQGGIVVGVATAGIAINAFTALLFLREQRHDVNVRGAFVHMAADAGVSVGVVLAGLAIHLTGAAWIDPVTSLTVSALIAAGTWGLLRESLDLALDAVPAGIDPEEVRAYLAGQPGITAVHDLHIWAMSTTEPALTAHLVKPDSEGDDRLLSVLCEELRTRFGIGHVTLQWERGDGDHECRQQPVAST